MIKPVTFINFKANKKIENKNLKQKQPQNQTSLYKTLPIAALLSLATAGTITTSCVMDNRTNEETSWLGVAFSRLSDEEIQKINETRQTPKNTVIAKIKEYKTEEYEDFDGETRTREVPTGKWHYELVNNRSGLEQGTTILPEGYIVKKDILGFIKIVEAGKKSIFLSHDAKEKAEIKHRDTIANDVSALEALTGLLSDEQIEKINKTRVMPEGSLITQNENGKYEITSDVTGLSTGTRLLPEGYELRKDVLGFATVVPMDQKSVFLRNKKTKDYIDNNTNIDFIEANFKVLSDKQIAEINKTRKLPKGTVIQKNDEGDFYISSDVTDLSTGTRTLPKGFEVKKNVFGIAVIVPVGTKGVLIRE